MNWRRSEQALRKIPILDHSVVDQEVPGTECGVLDVLPVAVIRPRIVSMQIVGQ